MEKKEELHGVDTRWPTQKKNLKLLDLFNDIMLEIKTDLKNSLNKSEKLSLSFGGKEPNEVQPFVVDDKSVKSIVLNLRFLFQHQDCSLERLKVAYEALDIHENYQKLFLEMKKTADNYIDDYSELYDRLSVSYTRYTHKEIIETFIYGQYAHRKPKFRKRIELWLRNVPEIGFYQTIFFKTIPMYIGILLLIRDFNIGVIENFGTDSLVIKDFGSGIQDFDFKRLIKNKSANVNRAICPKT